MSVPVALRCIVPVLVFLCCTAYGYAGGWPQPEGRLFAKLYGGVSTAGSYYDKEGSLITEHRFNLTGDGDTTLRSVSLTDEFNAVLGGLYAEYGLTENLTLILDVPVGYFQLNRRARVLSQNPEAPSTITREDTLYSITSPVYYGLGARYRIGASGKLQTSLVAAVHVPPGFSSPIVGNPDYPFLSDGAFEVRGGVEFGIPASFGWAAVGAMYNWRDEELKDELLVHAEVGFNKVENTYFKVHADLVQSMSSFGNDVVFTPRQTLLQENYFAAGASFGLFLSKIWFVDVDYSVRLFGANTWNLSTVVLGTGLVLDDL